MGSLSGSFLEEEPPKPSAPLSGERSLLSMILPTFLGSVLYKGLLCVVFVIGLVSHEHVSGASPRKAGIPEMGGIHLKMSSWVLSDGLAKCVPSGWKPSAFRILTPPTFQGVSWAISWKVAHIRFWLWNFCVKTFPLEFCGLFFLNPDLGYFVNMWGISRSFHSGKLSLSFLPFLCF